MRVLPLRACGGGMHSNRYHTGVNCVQKGVLLYVRMLCTHVYMCISLDLKEERVYAIFHTYDTEIQSLHLPTAWFWPLSFSPSLSLASLSAAATFSLASVHVYKNYVGLGASSYLLCIVVTVV